MVKKALQEQASLLSFAPQSQATKDILEISKTLS
jgi:hypothetical protein